MRIVVAHNFYQKPGGEDGVFHDEVALLRRHGHEVDVFTSHNDELLTRGRLPQLVDAVWNGEKARSLAQCVRRNRAEVVHFHNTFPVISPAAYYACHRAGAAVVQTLHNYRLICPGSLLYRDGAVCEKCVGVTVPLSAIRHRCYRNSFTATAATTLMISLHRMTRTWQREVDAYIALTNFGRSKFIAGGLPADRLSVKPNFLDPDPGAGTGAGGHVLFVGRLTEDKGLRTLLAAWRLVEPKKRLIIVGDGPLRAEAEQEASKNQSIDVLGWRSREEVLHLLRDALCLVFPSRWYEGQPRTVIESLACGTPVIASRLGAIAETLESCDPRLLFDPASAESLAAALRSFLLRSDHDSERRQARNAYLQNHTADQNLTRLIAVYRSALARYQTCQN